MKKRINHVIFFAAPAFGLFPLRAELAVTMYLDRFTKPLINRLDQDMGIRPIPVRKDGERRPAVAISAVNYDATRTLQYLWEALELKATVQPSGMLEGITLENAEAEADKLCELFDRAATENQVTTALVISDPISTLFLYRAYCEKVGMAARVTGSIGIEEYPVCVYYADQSHGKDSSFNGTGMIYPGVTFAG